MKVKLTSVAVLTLLLAAWELYARFGGVDTFILPSPSEIFSAGRKDSALLWSNFVPTASEILLGIAVAAIAGSISAFLLNAWEPFRAAIYPLLIASQTLPIVIVAPLLVAWLGYGLAPKLAIVTLVCFFPITVTTLDGLARADRQLKNLMRTLGASQRQVFRFVELPAALPSLFSGAKIAVTVAVIGAVLAEQAGSSEGLGHLIMQAIPQFQTARAYAAVVLLGVFAVVLFLAMSLMERIALPWTRYPNRHKASFTTR